MDPTTMSLNTLRSLDISRVSSDRIRIGIAAIDDHGLWRARIEDSPTNDERKRKFLCDELIRRGEKAPA